MSSASAGSIEVYPRADKVVLVIHGYYSTERAVESAAATVEALGQMGGGDFVADFTDATGFDTEGRKHWQDRLKELRALVRTVCIINGPPLMRMAAAAVCLYAGIKLRTLTTLEEAFLDTPKRVGSL